MIRRKFLLLILGVMTLSSMVSVAKDKNSNDNVIARRIGVEPAEIIMAADSIVAQLSVWENDTLPPKVLTSCMCSIVQYALCQPVMYLTDKRVYTAFYADVRLVVYKDSSFLTLELDYNTNKWRLFDEKGELICRYDLKNSELLSLMHDLWPESENINIKYEKFID